MATLSGMYKRHLADSGMEKAAVDTYRDLFNTTAKGYNSINSTREIKKKIVCSPSLNLAEIINLVADCLQIALMGTKVYW